ncbi:beta-lactamase family protein [Bombilactobacillus folatiphilus]|uniref:Beta-lactamase family protein n=1 Tax=Bombilactobacillus folatiphilus TaxID=2923362 RepID=A0ABY4P9V0_9LACO|nr:serine hydrolase domain-containing protein [Bombilactobacillus folatiphilus]UQS82394.1 beta-lactamase family protein [Bombilactobacillus folatiphilus]
MKKDFGWIGVLFLMLVAGSYCFKTPVQATSRMQEQKTISNILKQNEFSGTALIIKHGQPFYQATQGYADYQKRQALSMDSTYQLASLEKAVTATLLMKAQEQGRLHLSDSLHAYLPQIPYSANLNLWHLLKMESGLVLPPASVKTALTTRKLPHYLNKHTKFVPEYRNRWHYSDVNYILLAQILTQVYHRSYAQLFQQYIVQPLHLQNTGVTANYLHNQHAVLAYAVNGQPANYDTPLRWSWNPIADELGAGQLYADAHELYRLEKAIVQGEIIKLKDVQKLRKPGATNIYNGGVYHEVSKHYFYAHGVQQGFDTVVLMSDDGQNAVILLSNRHNNRQQNFIQLAKQFYGLMHPN